MANGIMGKLDELSDYLKKIQVPGTDMNLGELTVDFLTTTGGASIFYAATNAIAPALASTPTGGAIALIGGAWLGAEISQSANVAPAVKDKIKYMVVGAVAVALAALFLPGAVFGVMPGTAAKALQSVVLLVK